MRVPLVICDDSAMARQQLHSCLPEEWQVEVSFATNGEEALALVREGKARVMFLDLTMPVMSGYEVLRQLQAEELACDVFVVSADVQPRAVERVMQLGALEFLSKPIDRERMRKCIETHGLMNDDG